MGLANGCSFISPLFSNNVKVLALDSTLQQFVINFKELVSDYEQLKIECETAKQELSTLKNKHVNDTSNEMEELKKVIAFKNGILQSVASSLTKLNDTKDWNVLSEIFKILFKGTSSPEKKPAIKNTTTIKEAEINSVKVHPKTSPKSEISGNVKDEKLSTDNVNGEISITEDVSFKEESLCEIEGTPGRTSPILHTKKAKSIIGKSSDLRDKKKCSADWPSPDSKSIKLTYRTPRGKGVRLKQTRINVASLKQTCLIDLTCSPDFSGGRRNANTVLPLVKKESIENDDTILPSPTSGPTSFTKLKTTNKDNPSKFKRPLSLKVKTEKCDNEPKLDENRNAEKDITNAEMEYSINILNPLASRFNDAGVKKDNLVMKSECGEHTPQVAMDQDATDCETNSSISLLDHVKNLERDHHGSPPKRPLVENINAMNTPPEDPSESILQPDKKIAVEYGKRKLPELVEPIYKEPTVRNKQEKRNLQGWSCEQCKNFYGELYKNDPVMLARKINECSKHRGRHNPERPKTPPNFWNPRWHVPTDTEELNRMNNAN